MPEDTPTSEATSLEKEQAKTTEDIETTEESTETVEEPKRELIDAFVEKHGLKNPERFADDDAFMESLDNARRKVGQQDKMAEWGEEVRKRADGNPQKWDTFLSDDEPEDTGNGQQQEWDPTWVIPDGKGGVAYAAHAPKNVKDLFHDRGAQMIANPGQFLEGVIQDRIEKAQAETAKATKVETAKARDEAAQNTWSEKHKELLWAGEVLTPDGRLIVDKANQIQTSEPGMSFASCLEYARLQHQADKPKSATPDVQQKALRKPAASGGTPMTAAEKILQGKGTPREDFMKFGMQEE